LGDLTHQTQSLDEKEDPSWRKRKPTTPEPKASRTWERLEDFVRGHVQCSVQALLEEEVTNGTITGCWSRVRDLNERFVSRVLPLFKRQTKKVGELLPKLYLHGLALGDFELTLHGLLGEGAPIIPRFAATTESAMSGGVYGVEAVRLDDLAEESPL
jgi:hypothetical protein